MGSCIAVERECGACGPNLAQNKPVLSGERTPRDSKQRWLLPSGHLEPCDGGARCRCGRGITSTAVVFLDVDGVLHAVGSPLSHLFGTQHLAQLRRIIDMTNARIVLSTAWRLSDWCLERLLSELMAAGLPSPFSATPSLLPCMTEGRALEIRAWLKSHGHLVELDRWVAIDDIPLAPDLPSAHVVTTQPQEGLTPALADAAIAKLMVTTTHI